MSAPNPADMTKCNQKSRCVGGVNDGLAYDAANPCDAGAIFNAVACDCEDSGCWEITRVRDCRLDSGTLVIKWYKPPSSVDQNGNIIYYKFFRGYGASICPTNYYRDPCVESGSTPPGGLANWYDGGRSATVSLVNSSTCQQPWPPGVDYTNYQVQTSAFFGIFETYGDLPSDPVALESTDLGGCAARCSGPLTATVTVSLRYLGPGQCSQYP